VVMCFGPDAAPYRVDLYPGYHADRPEIPDLLASQFAAARPFFSAFDWAIADTDEFEADDLLGSLADAEAAAGGHTLIMTGDRDLYQCVSDSVSVLYVKTGSRGAEVVDPAEVRKRYGVEPSQVPDFIALRGDPSDGLPGAKGIGEKTAATLLQQHGTLDELLEAPLLDATPRIRGALQDQREELLAFREIARLQEAPVELPPDLPTNFQAAAAAAREFGMSRLATRLEEMSG
jgi:5'-3' exonuclease